MKVAIAADGKACSNHFGHCSGFQIYEIENNQIVDEKFIPNSGHKPNYLPNYLKEAGISVIIASRMGGNAQQLFREHKIEIIVGVSGSLNEVIKNYLKGNLKSNNRICSDRVFSGNCQD